MTTALALLNLDHDLALRSGAGNYIPGRHVARMMDDLALLPYWLCNGCVIVSPKSLPPAMSDAAASLGIDNCVARWDELHQLCRDLPIRPWGWNMTLARRLSARGFTAVPSSEDLHHIRRLSSREASIPLLERLREADGTVGQRTLVTSVADMGSYTDFVAKPLWSSSGKGLVWNDGAPTASTLSQVAAEIKRCGGVVVEPLCRDKILDFAMEFEIGMDGRCGFLGYSVFETDSHGRYERNLLGSATDARVAALLPDSLTDHVKSTVIGYAEENFSPYYKGPFGIDMMVCRDGDGIKLHPCVEVNLRMNMGIVALHLSRLAGEGRNGHFSIKHCRDAGSLRLFHEQMSQENPLAIIDKKIAKGYLPLTPVGDDTQHLAYVVIR